MLKEIVRFWQRLLLVVLFVHNLTNIWDLLQEIIDLPMVPLDQVRTIALRFAVSNRLLFYTALFPFVAGLISSIKGIYTLKFITVPLANAIALVVSVSVKNPSLCNLDHYIKSTIQHSGFAALKFSLNKKL